MQGVFTISIRRGEIKHWGREGNKVPKYNNCAQVRVLHSLGRFVPQKSPTQAGKNQETSAGLPWADQWRELGDTVSRGSRAALPPTRGAAVCVSKEAPPWDVEPHPQSWLWDRVRGASRGSEGSHPGGAGKPPASRPPAPDAPYLALELVVGEGGRAAPRCCVGELEAEGWQQQPAQGTHPPHFVSQAWAWLRGVRRQGPPGQASW